MEMKKNNGSKNVNGVEYNDMMEDYILPIQKILEPTDYSHEEKLIEDIQIFKDKNQKLIHDNRMYKKQIERKDKKIERLSETIAIFVFVIVITLSSFWLIDSKIGHEVSTKYGEEKIYITYDVKKGDTLTSICNDIIKKYSLEDKYRMQDLRTEVMHINNCYNYISYDRTLTIPIIVKK